MSFEEEIYVTSRSRTPSLIDVTSHNERVFKQLPDLIQEAIVSKDCELFCSCYEMETANGNSLQPQTTDKSGSE